MKSTAEVVVLNLPTDINFGSKSQRPDESSAMVEDQAIINYFLCICTINSDPFGSTWLSNCGHFTTKDNFL